MRERIIYECEHCYKKRLLSKYQMKEHEEKCFYNPTTKSCITCGSFNCWGTDRSCESSESNIDLSEKLKSNCQYWSELEEEI